MLSMAFSTPEHPWKAPRAAKAREILFEATANGSVVFWQHINLLGEYDFSDEKLQDSVGIKPPKLAA
jgi:hypothetical protein